jgi:putative transcriptional regulator
MDVITPGIFLISDPFLKDPNFMRTVVLLCEHQTEGSFGFVLNKASENELGDLIKGAEGIDFPVFEGGPVQKNSLHFIHQRPDVIEGGVEVIDGIFWGGDFELVLELIRSKQVDENDIRFFLGYSGWGEGQLDLELADKSWITREANRKMVFTQNTQQIWKAALKDLGGEYSRMINYPIDPQLN